MKYYLALSIILVASLSANENANPDSKRNVIPKYFASGPPVDDPNAVEVPVKKGDKVILEYIPADEPFLTGPLLCPSGHTIPYGHIDLEPYVFFANNIGFYGNHWHIHRFSEPQDSINFQYLIQCGISEKFDFTFVPQLFYHYTGNQNNIRYGDFACGIGYQLYTSRYDSWLPTTKIGFMQLFPSGEYDGLDILKLGTDVGGGGSYASNIKIVMTDLFYLGNHHFLSLRLSNSLTFFTNVKVHGANSYGGDDTTIGTVKPGWAYEIVLGSEFTLSRHWALALDIDFVTTAATTFEGTTIASVGRDYRSDLLSFAPAIEYNFNANVGLIGGVWFTAYGRGSIDFTTGVIALNWFFP